MTEDEDERVISQSSLPQSETSIQNQTRAHSILSLKFWIQIAIILLVQTLVFVFIYIFLRNHITENHLCKSENIDKVSQNELTGCSEKSLSVENLQSQLTDIKGQLKNITDDYKALKDDIMGIKRELNLHNKEFGDMYSYIVLFLVLMLIAAIFAIPKVLQQIERRNVNETITGNVLRERVGGQEKVVLVEDIVKELSKKRREKGIGIISFSSSTKKFHLQILKTVPMPKSFPVHDYVVGSVRDVLKISPHEIFIIFVDSNERDIILENPETEIGDLRRKTTEIFIKINCDVFLIYCKNKGSESLPQDEFYNTSLHSINQRPMLSTLSNKNRLLSVYDTFHPQQVKLLEDRFKQLGF